jgi:hypothetical protein
VKGLFGSVSAKIKAKEPTKDTDNPSAIVFLNSFTLCLPSFLF